MRTVKLRLAHSLAPPAGLAGSTSLAAPAAAACALDGLDTPLPVQTLNRVLDHAKLPKAARYTRAMVDAASGFSGNYSRNDFTPSVRRGAAALRQRTQRQTADLDDLLNTFWPSMRFSGLTPEL